ncbi:hypothetical protein FISHEDRAFT_37966 [Fistulina hepatica ATCC 64428]|nr:hypothetical protein FISHEDRAFT_37966 [Fistulina hepatica ATCC 64428]
MSLSASDSNGSYSRVPSSGKTPPPAPSAAYARRPPALRALASSGSPPSEASPSAPSPADSATLSPNNYPPGFRRARAGTLPSNVQLAAQRFAAASLSSTHASTESLLDQRQPATPTATLGSARPSLRHSASVQSVTAAVANASTPSVPSLATERNSRLRSGSLTLPSRGLSNAFGASLFSSSWLSSTGSGTTGSFPVLEELRSATSAGEAASDDFDVHTLDYLGLDDAQRAPATMSELRSQAQSRLRATTVSNPYRSRPHANSLMSTPAAEEEEDYFDDYHDPTYNRASVNPYDLSDAGYSSSTFLSQGYKPTDHLVPARPRAISVASPDDHVRTITRRATTADQHPYLAELGPHQISPSLHFSNGEASGRSPTYLVAPSGQNRSVSPKTESSTQIQTPTRSLWIGNLDSAVTSEQLIHVFAPYGAIESLRLLPEKECGFVNFVDQADAIRAKEDVLNRLGGNIGMPNGQAVRIGFGKADSAPVAPAKGSPAASSPVSPAGMQKTSSSASASAGMNSIESQLQSTPTRALWIGSIPSTTTPATILSVFSPYGPIESARVLTHKNCGFINFERLDDAVRARKALNGRDVLGSDVGAIRIGFAKVPVKNGTEGGEEGAPVTVSGVGNMSVGSTIHALRNVKGASTVPSDQQVLSGTLENYRSNLLLSMIASGNHMGPDGTIKAPGTATLTEQQMVMRELSGGSADAEGEIQALAEFRPPTMYYTSIPLVSERSHNKRWDAAKLRELRKRLDSGTMSLEDIDTVTNEFIDGEIVDLASDWLGNTVVQKLFERCSAGPRMNMLERISPHLAMIGIHKNGTWAAQKIIECVQTPEEIALVAQNLRPYAPPLLLDQFGNYVVQCCLRFGSPADDFIFDAIVDRMWEVAQGRFGARSMRACLESPHITVNQQRRVATAIVLNSIPLATNPNGALLLTWLLDTSGFPSRYNLLAPRFIPHLSHLCTHKLASLTVLRIVNQKIEPSASTQLVDALFQSPGDHVLTDVLGDQVNGVAVVHKILTSPFLDPNQKTTYMEATKRVLIELKVIATQAYRRLIEEVGLPVPNFQPAFSGSGPQSIKAKSSNNSYHTQGLPGLPSGYPSNDQGLASMMASLQMGGQNPQAGPPQLQIDPMYNTPTYHPSRRTPTSASANEGFAPFPSREGSSPRPAVRRQPSIPTAMSAAYGSQSPNLSQMMGVSQPVYPAMNQQPISPQLYQYMYQTYQQSPPPPPNMGTFHT